MNMMNIRNKNQKTPAYSFVAPCFNEEANILLLYEKILKLMKTISLEWELILVNDGSSDDTEEVVKFLTEKDKRVKYLGLSRNFGHQSALTAGLDHAQGKAIITLDADLQDPPEVIGEMIRKWKAGFDIVYARRRNRHDNLFKKYTALGYYKLLDKFSEVKIPRNVGDFRLTDRKVLIALKGMKEKARYLRGMVAWLGFKHAFVDYDRPERQKGKTGYTITKMARLAMDGILNFSLLPLRIGLFMGLLSILAGSLFLIYMILDKIINNTIYQLYKWLAVILLIFAGIQFMFLWILGEYLGRVYEETKGRPLYVITEKKGLD